MTTTITESSPTIGATPRRVAGGFACIALLCAATWLAAASAIAAPPSARPAAPVATRTPGQLPASVPQGGLLLGRVDGAVALSRRGAGTEPAAAIRLAPDGGFVLGIGRDEAGPVELDATYPDGTSRHWTIPVVARAWRLERVDGVPEATVNPPPDIAARIEREQARVAAARTRDDPREDYAGGFDWPVHGRVSGVYGSQRIYNGTPKSPHSGLDVAAAKGTPVHAPAAGIVTLAEPDLYLTGGTVLLDHGHGLSSNFLPLSRLDVKVGERVERGGVIGLVGATGRATGPHMHWGANWFGVRIDPALLLPATDPEAAAAAAPSR
jgi:murein DD-endopeptidase MepM/ murein hydrolase activator NlpD